MRNFLRKIDDGYPKTTFIFGLVVFLFFVVTLKNGINNLIVGQSIAQSLSPIPPNIVAQSFLFQGTCTPTISAPKGSLFLCNNGSGINNRAFINTDGATGWTAIVTSQ